MLTEKVPYIPVNYIPQLNFPKYVEGLLYLLQERESSYSALATELAIGKGTADNLVRDLVMIGHAEANRRSETVKAIHSDREEAELTLRNFFSSHVVFRRLVNDVGAEGRFSDELLRDLVKRVLGSPAFSVPVLENYAQKLSRWFLGVGLIKQDVRDYVLNNNPVIGSLAEVGNRLRRRGVNLFLGEAPPEKVVGALSSILAGTNSRDDVEKRHGRNSVYSLMNLGVVDKHGDLIDTRDSALSATELIRRAAAQSVALQFVLTVLNATPSRSGEEIGIALADRLGVTWSSGSKKRCGAGLKRWAIWYATNPAPSQEANRTRTMALPQALFDYEKQ